MRCDEVREELPAYAGGEASLAVRRHLSTCADCRAELARYEELTSAMASLEAVTAEPPAGLKRALLAIPDEQTRVAQVRKHVARNRTAYLGGAGAVAVAAAGAVLLRRRLAAA